MRTVRTPLVAVHLDPAAFGVGGGEIGAWLSAVRALEHAGVDLITVADRVGAPDGVARLDPVMRVAWLSAQTTSIGLMAAVETTVSEPFLVAAQLATADFISHGRAGWLLQVSGEAEGGGYVGPRGVATGAAAWAEAAEHVEVVRRLWDSWEDSAVIADVPGQRYIDRDLVHHIDFRGDFLSVVGPSITPRSPQAQAPVGMALENGGDHSRVAFVLRHADVLFLGDGFNADGVRLAAAEDGRSVRLLADLAVGEASVGRVGELLSDGFAGVRLVLSVLPDDIDAVVGLSGALGLRSGLAGGGDGGPSTLRGRLGLQRPQNRFAQPRELDGPNERTGMEA